MNPESHDPFALLKLGDPSPIAETPGFDSEIGQQIYQRVVAGEPATRLQPTKTRRLVAVGIAILAACAIAAAVWSITREVRQTSGLICHEAPELDSNGVVIVDPEQFDTSICESHWRSGALLNTELVAQGQVPPLLGCVDDQGVFVVFPTGDAQLCQSLGLADHQPNAQELPGTILSRRLSEIYETDTCRSIDDANAIVIDLLNELDLDEWTITIGAEPSAARPCASFGHDSVTQIVYITPVPIPEPNSSESMATDPFTADAEVLDAPQIAQTGTVEPSIRLVDRLGIPTIEVALIKVPEGTDTFEISINGRVRAGGTYIPGAVAGVRVDESTTSFDVIVAAIAADGTELGRSASRQLQLPDVTLSKPGSE